MPKIAFLGAGSMVFATKLVGDVLSFEELSDSTIPPWTSTNAGSTELRRSPRRWSLTRISTPRSRLDYEPDALSSTPT